MAKKLNKGDKVRLTDKALKWHFDYAHEMHMVGTKLDVKGLETELRALTEHALGTPMIVVGENWPNSPDFNYRVKLRNWSMNVGPEDLVKVRV